jgi:hypothetical protein
MHVAEAPSSNGPTVRDITPGTILVSPAGQVKIVRTRTKCGTGWNCADGAGITDVEANDTEQWSVFAPEQLASDLSLAREVRELGGLRELRGGLATWDACSGRICQLPKLAKMLH